MKCLLLLLLCACRSPIPDHIGFTVGHGESDFNNTARTGFDTNYGEVSAIYDLDKKAEPAAAAHDARYEEWLWQKDKPVPAAPEPTPAATEAPVSHTEAGVSETPHDQPKPIDPKAAYIPGAIALLGLLADILIGKKKEHVA